MLDALRLRRRELFFVAIGAAAVAFVVVMLMLRPWRALIDEVGADARPGGAVVASGVWGGRDGWSVEGEVALFPDAVHFSDFRAERSPEPDVVLVRIDGEELDLGEVRANVGEVTIPVPGAVDVSSFERIELRDGSLGVVMATANLAPTS